MSDWQIRPAVSTDIRTLTAMDHGGQTTYVWQMNWEVSPDGLQVQARFRRVRLPREVWLTYPRDVQRLPDVWNRQAVTLVAARGEQLGGYVRIEPRHDLAWVTDWVVNAPWRLQGLGAFLLQAAEGWARARNLRQLTLEMISKNDPAVRLAQRAGYEFCGYHDQYYASQEVALFYGKIIQ